MAQLEQMLSKVQDTTYKVKDKIKKKEEKENKQKDTKLEEETTTLDPILLEDPFLKAIKEINSKALEGIPLFSGKMDLDLIMEWIEGMENHFECDGVSNAQMVKVKRSRLRGTTLIWWKFVQTKREK